MPDDVVTVMDRLQLAHADMMGYSMGGWITLNLLSCHASRLASAIAGGAGLRSAMQHAERTPPDDAVLTDLTLPVLVVVGDEDPVLNSARQLAQTLRNGALKVVPNADHLGTVASPFYKAAVIEFLDTVNPVSTAT